MLRVSETDVKALLPFSKAIELAGEAYVRLASGEVANPQRGVLRIPNGASMFFMPSYINGQRNAVVKIVRENPNNSRMSLSTVLLTLYAYDAVTGAQVAEVDGEWLTAVRTASSTAVATDLLARKDVRVLGVFGSGVQARAHIPALRLVRDFDEVLVYSREKNRTESFAREMSRETEAKVEAAHAPDQVASESDVIVTATTSQSPVFDGRLVKAGAHVNAIGSAYPDAREVDSNLVKRARVVVDSRTQALETYGDIMTPVHEGVISESSIQELGELLIDRRKMAARVGEITLFKAGGLAVLDAMVTNHILESFRPR
jgi:alanine dehydrogenase